jgi:hypothetical protein
MHGDRFRYARQVIYGLMDRLAPDDQIAIYGFHNLYFYSLPIL